MKQIVGLGYGAVAFTPGAAGAGTLVFSGFTGFAPSRLLAVTDVTENALIYAAEKRPHGTDPGAGGVWTSATAAGGTLTLNADTTGYNAADLLRCIYDADEAPPISIQQGGNYWPKSLDTCDLDSGHTRTADYGPGPRPGTRSTRFAMAGSNNTNKGVNTGLLTLIGRTDGAMFGLAVWAKGSGSFQLRIRATGTSSGQILTEAVVFLTASGTWTLHVLKTPLTQFDCSSVQGEIRVADADSATLELCMADFRLLDSFNGFPEYQPPCGVAQSIYATRLTTSVAAWTDSMWSPAGSPVPISAILKGAKVYNGGIGGQTSTQVKDRFIGTATADKINRAHGVQVLWCGHNNPAVPIDLATLISDIDAMIAAMNHGRYLVLPMLAGTLGAPGGIYRTYYEQAYKAMKQRYGRNFCDPTGLLYGDTGFTLPAYRLDTIHLTNNGLEIIGQCLARGMQQNGWLDAGAWDFGSDEPSQYRSLLTSVTAAVASTAILGYGRRHGFRIVNETATGVLYLAYGDSASVTSYTVKMAPGDSHERIGDDYHGPVYGYWTVADGSARVTEII